MLQTDAHFIDRWDEWNSRYRYRHPLQMNRIDLNVLRYMFVHRGESSTPPPSPSAVKFMSHHLYSCLRITAARNRLLLLIFPASRDQCNASIHKQEKRSCDIDYLLCFVYFYGFCLKYY